MRSWKFPIPCVWKTRKAVATSVGLMIACQAQVDADSVTHFDQRVPNASNAVARCPPTCCRRPWLRSDAHWRIEGNTEHGLLLRILVVALTLSTPNPIQSSSPWQSEVGGSIPSTGPSLGCTGWYPGGRYPGRGWPLG